MAGKCGLAFKYHYVDGLPAPQQSAAAIFGNVLHHGLAEWYGGGMTTEDNKHRHKDLDLVKCCQDRWAELLPPKVWEHVSGMVALEAECQAVAEAIKLRRPTIKAPMQTKDFLVSQAKLEFNEAKEALLEICNKTQEIKWPQNEDPFQAYLKVKQIATRLQREWKPLPRPLAVEQQFTVEFDDWKLHGHIDQIRLDPDLETGQTPGARIVDAKSGKQPLSQMEAIVQAFLYWEAVRQMDDVPDTNDFEFWLLRHVDQQGKTKVQQGRIDPTRHRELVLRILRGRTRQIFAAQFEPSYGFWCRQCDFRDLCEQEISLWEGDGILQGTTVV